MEFGKSNWRSYEQGIQKEWLLTNGIGGFASSTVVGANTRRYHGLLTASLKPPVKRHLILSKLDECIEVGNACHNLYSFQTSNDSSANYTLNGFAHLQRFKLDPFPTYIFNISNVFVEKKIVMVYGENTIIVSYHIKNGDGRSRLKITPLVNFRDYHGNSHKNFMRFDQNVKSNILSIKPQYSDRLIDIYFSEGVFVRQYDNWFQNMDYAVERERGLYSIEDHFVPGYFEIDIKPWEDKLVNIIATVDGIKETDALYLIDREEKRINWVISQAGYGDSFADMLVSAADKFIVYRQSTYTRTIIAGYPWFTDWGRDTMISLPGLTLATKRYNDAEDILFAFAEYTRDGLVPNMFPDEGRDPLYNTVDAALWYFEAVHKYLKYTENYEFIRKDIFKVLKEIVHYYMNGTKYNIRMEENHLITAGNKGTQLTWMDAKVGDWVVTPRHGKAVEINALWYNALKIIEYLSGRFGEDNTNYTQIADEVRKSFIQKFWNEKKQCLYDVITGEYYDDKVRPNQIFAVSLSYPVLEGDKAGAVVNTVFKELYTPYGLRSLSPHESEYAGTYIGDQYRRDGAYHQGTVWSWLMGHFVTAYRRVNKYSPESRKMALMLLEPFKDHLHDACLGNISEIFDGDDPHIPRGCFAQAWGVAEVLRAYVEEVLQQH